MGVTTMMKTKLNTTLAAAIIGIALTGAANANPITYAVSLFDLHSSSIQGDTEISIAGSITTDGTMGMLTAANIIDWNLVGVMIANPDPTFFIIDVFANFTGPLSGNNSQMNGPQNIIATPLTLQVFPTASFPSAILDFQ